MNWKAVLRIRPRPVQSVKFGGGHGFHPPKVTAYKAQLRGLVAKYGPPEPLRGPLRLEATFVLPVLKRDKGRLWWWHDTKPDLTNLVKPLEDALQGPVVTNDSQIVAHGVKKIREPGEGEIRVEVTELIE